MPSCSLGGENQQSPATESRSKGTKLSSNITQQWSAAKFASERTGQSLCRGTIPSRMRRWQKPSLLHSYERDLLKFCSFIWQAKSACKENGAVVLFSVNPFCQVLLLKTYLYTFKQNRDLNIKVLIYILEDNQYGVIKPSSSCAGFSSALVWSCTLRHPQQLLKPGGALGGQCSVWHNQSFAQRHKTKKLCSLLTSHLVFSSNKFKTWNLWGPVWLLQSFLSDQQNSRSLFFSWKLLL